MKTLSKQELINRSKNIFKQYSDAKKVFATEDGQFFLEENRANLHARSNTKRNKRKKSIHVIEINREDAGALTKSPKKGSVQKEEAEALIARIPSIDSKEELDALKKGEKRTTVLKAITAQMAELEKAKNN